MSTDPAANNDEPGPAPPDSPSCHDGVTMTCPVCQQPFGPVGRRKYCGDACRATAYRRRRDAGRVPIVLPRGQPSKPVTVYACDSCGTRAVGDQRCEECRTFMRRVGLGGTCPSCDEHLSVEELLGGVSL
ncbi:MAG: hypothetical protein ACR2KK_12905 [Acidimicrobiales bacterium]